MKHNTFQTYVSTIVLFFFFCLASANASEWSPAAKEKWDDLVEQGTDLFLKQNYEPAIEIEKQALALAEQNVGPDHQDTGESLNGLGTLYSLTKRYKDAEPLLERALVISEKASDMKGQKTVLDNMGEMYQNMREFKKSEQAYTRSLEITEKIYGPEDKEVGKTLSVLGSLCLVERKIDKAESLFLRALALAEKSEGAQGEDVGVLSGFLGKLYMVKGNFPKVETYLGKALPMRERALGLKHHFVTRMQNDLAMAYAEQGKHDKAIPLLEQALESNQKIFPSAHPEIALNLSNLGVCYGVQKQFDKSISVLERALAIYEKLDAKSLDVVMTLEKLAFGYFRLHDYDKAEAMTERELSLVSNKIGADRPETQAIRKQLDTIRAEKTKRSKVSS